MRKILPLVLLFILVSARPAFAHKWTQAILGDATSSTLPTIAPTAEGPGLLTPDSPFWFLDQWKQNVRLLLAFTPEAKVKVREQIAGERLAELRVMLTQNNRVAAKLALEGVSENLKEASSEVSKAQFQGRDVKALAKEVNDNIKARQKILDDLETKSSGVLQLEVRRAQEQILESKVEVEDSLPEDQLRDEVRADLERKIERKVKNASNSAVLLQKDLNELNKEASESARKSLKRRQEALKEAIEKSNGELRKTQEKLLEAEQRKQEVLLEVQKKAATEAQDALKKALEAATKFQSAQQSVFQITNSSNIVSCTGPDNKTFQTTKEACQAFVNAWGKGSVGDSISGPSGSAGGSGGGGSSGGGDHGGGSGGGEKSGDSGKRDKN